MPVNRLKDPDNSTEWQAKVEWLHVSLIERGLLPNDFKPMGDTAKEKYSSLRSRATVEFYRLNPSHRDDPLRRPGNLWGESQDQPPASCHYNPEQLPDMAKFSDAARASGFTPIADTVDSALRALPRGDSHQDPDR